MPKGSLVSGVFMGTTSIPVHHTISEVQQILIKAGAQAITTVHEKSKISGMSFSIPCTNGDLSTIRTYTLPIRTQNQTQGDGRTIYQVFQAGERKMLESGTDSY